MKDLIIQALTDAILVLDTRIPSTKSITKSISIEDVEPLDLADFMADNHIPSTAFFGTEESYTLGSTTEVKLYYEIQVPMTDADTLKFKKSKFSQLAFKRVLDILKGSGYKRCSCSSRFFKEFDGTTVYDMYMAKEFDRLVEYYSLSFIKV